MLVSRVASAVRCRRVPPLPCAAAPFTTTPPASFFTGAMFKNQGPHALPKLPVPTLEETMAKFEWTAQPLLRSDDERKQTAAECQAFLSGKGRSLQAELVHYDQQRPDSNYIVDFWYDMYLNARDPLPINMNPFIMFKDTPINKDWVACASSYAVATTHFYTLVRDRTLSPDMFAQFPLDMSQYPWLFASTRLPTPRSDTLQISSSNPGHIAVTRGGSIFKVHVLDASGKPLPLAQVHSQMMGIASAPATPASSNPGILTTAPRDDWTAARATLAKDATNAASLKTIDDALFVVALDDSAPATRAAEARTMLFGDGRSRWFDKSFTLIVTRSGKVAVNFEHSWGDGVCVLRMCNDVHAAVSKSCASALAEVKSVQAHSVAPLVFNTQQVAGEMAAAAKRFDEHAGSMKNIVVECKGLSRQQVKEFKVSPDGVMQMAIQLAYTRLHKQTVSVYESASTSSFLRGRTETIRSCTPASAAFVATMMQQTASAEDKNRALRNACAVHGDVTFAALTGKGIDRHLFALKQLAARQPGPLPAFFSLPAYNRMIHNTLSTSTLSSPALDGGGFGPVVVDGYGVGYGIQDDGSGFSVTSYMDTLPAFGSALQEAVADMQAVLHETQRVKH